MVCCMSSQGINRNAVKYTYCFTMVLIFGFATLLTTMLNFPTRTIIHIHDQSNMTTNIQTQPYNLYNHSSKSNYIKKMITWSVSPNSFCFENYYFYFENDKDSSHILLSIMNVNELNRNLTMTKQFTFYLRISRILYANKYQYKYCEFGESFDISKPPHWSKWNAIRMISTLKNAKHILWTDIDAIFHSKTKSIENSIFYLNNYNKNKIFVFAKAGDNNGINAGIFMVNAAVNITDKFGQIWDVMDVLDLFSFIESDKKIKTYVPPYEQLVLRVFRKEYKTIF
eukprot:284597_1